MSKVRNLTKDEGERIGIGRFPSFHRTGSVRGMKKRFYGEDALLVKCGSYIYNVTDEPKIYHMAR